MYTQCPNCKTLFEITTDQLQAALGRAHCGCCNHVFNAVLNLRKYTEDEQDDFADVGAQLLTRRASHSAVEPPEEDRIAEEADVTAAPEWPTAQEDLDNMDMVTNGLAKYQASDATSAASRIEGAVVRHLQEQHGITPETATEGISTDPPAPATIQCADEKASVAPAASQEIPLLLMDDYFDREIKRSSWQRPMLWLGCAVLVAMLFIQSLYWRRAELAQDIEYRPWVNSLCGVLRCEIPMFQDPKLITLLERRVSPDPQRGNVLRLNVTFANTAPFVQKYPLLQLTFSDIRGKALARRRFLPEEYLIDRDPQDIANGLPIKTPTQAQLELLDPGGESIAYELDFL